MTDYFRGPLLGFDIESTGISPKEDRIVTFSMVYSHSPEAEPIILEWLINPGVEIPQGASDVHGVTTEYAQEHGQDPATALQDIANRLVPIVQQGIPLVAFNIPFDSTITMAEFTRHGVSYPYTAEQTFARSIDPLVIDKATDKYRKGSRKLIDTAKLFGYDLTNAHESTADVLATLHITRKLADKFKPEMTIELLQEFQKDSKQEQSESFQAYLRKKTDENGNLVEPNAIISSAWPYEE